MTFRNWLIAFATTMIFILIKGYTFNSGDQEEHLPQVYQMMNPALYPKDYFVSAFHQTFSVRFFFVWMIYLFQFIMPVSSVCFLFQLICITITAWAIQQIILHFKVSQLLADCTAFFAIVIFNRFTVGANALVDIQLTSSNISNALGALAFLSMLNKRWYVAAILAGVASLFQVLIGLQVFLIIGFLYSLPYNQKNIFLQIKFLMIYLLFASPMLFPTLYQQLKSYHESNDNTLFYYILYRVRNPNHYLPSTFPLADYIKFIFLTALAGIFHFSVNNELKQLWRNLFFIIVGGMLIYSFLVEGIGFMPIGKLQWFKVAGWMMMFNVIVIIYFLSELYLEKIKVVTRIFLPTHLILLCSFAALLIITNSVYLPSEDLRYRYHVGNYPETDLTKMHQWIKSNTPVDCLVLANPDDNSFLCEAQRSMPTGWKAIIHKPFFMIPWYHNFLLAYHNGNPFNGLNVLEQASEHYNKYPPLSTAKLYWDFRLVDLSQAIVLTEHEIIVHTEGTFSLLKNTLKNN